MPKRGGSRGRKKPSLISLSRASASSPEEIDRLYDEISSGSDRSLAIIATSSLHRALCQLIIHVLAAEAEVVEYLYERDGPLSSLYSATILAFAMRLIDKEVFENINIIRRIRNAFAHSAKPLSFEHPLISQECSKLVVRKTPHLKHVPSDSMVAKARFVFAAGTIELAADDTVLFSLKRTVKNAKRRDRRREKTSAPT